MLADKIRALRKGQQLSLTRLAKNAQISKSYLSQLESGASKTPSAQALYQIACALNVPIEYFLKHPKPTTPTHVWIDGPDGPQYHCAICGISRCNDHDAYSTCESWIKRQANHPEDLDALVQSWRTYITED